MLQSLFIVLLDRYYLAGYSLITLPYDKKDFKGLNMNTNNDFLLICMRKRLLIKNVNLSALSKPLWSEYALIAV